MKKNQFIFICSFLLQIFSAEATLQENEIYNDSQSIVNNVRAQLNEETNRNPDFPIAKISFIQQESLLANLIILNKTPEFYQKLLAELNYLTTHALIMLCHSKLSSEKFFTQLYIFSQPTDGFIAQYNQHNIPFVSSSTFYSGYLQQILMNEVTMRYRVNQNWFDHFDEYIQAIYGNDHFKARHEVAHDSIYAYFQLFPELSTIPVISPHRPCDPPLKLDELYISLMETAFLPIENVHLFHYTVEDFINKCLEPNDLRLMILDSSERPDNTNIRPSIWFPDIETHNQYINIKTAARKVLGHVLSAHMDIFLNCKLGVTDQFSELEVTHLVMNHLIGRNFNTSDSPISLQDALQEGSVHVFQ